VTLVRVAHTTASLDALGGLLDLATRAAREAGADDEGQHDIRLAAEEVLINVINHAYPAGRPGPLQLRARIEPGAPSSTRARRFPPTWPRPPTSPPNGPTAGSADSGGTWWPR